MFVYCDVCDYDSSDKDTMMELEEQVEKDGGTFGTGKDICPECGAVGTLHVD